MLSADLGDLIISLSLCYYLHTSHSGFRSTDLLIDRLIMFVVTRGILACGTGFIQLIAFLIWPDTFIFGVFHLMVSKCKSTVKLTSLVCIRDHDTSGTCPSIHQCIASDVRVSGSLRNPMLYNNTQGWIHANISPAHHAGIPYQKVTQVHPSSWVPSPTTANSAEHSKQP